MRIYNFVLILKMVATDSGLMTPLIQSENRNLLRTKFKTTYLNPGLMYISYVLPVL